MATTTVTPFTCAIFSSKTLKSHNHNFNFFNPKTRTKLFSSCKIGNHQRVILVPKLSNSCRPIVANLDSNEAEYTSESQLNIPSKEATIDIQLPRRSLLVQFTCNACGGRTERYINRLAYERGMVFVQCAGCLKHHKLVDNLGLVREYNLLEDTDTELND